jgi:DnaJ-class molecular chaperone
MCKNVTMCRYKELPCSEVINTMLACYECIHNPRLNTISTTIGWQLCPKCNGKGWMGTEYIKCDVCDSKKIINIITGKPPE